jgi:uncharacterized protein
MSVEPGTAPGPQPRRRSGLRPRTFSDSLYGEVRLSGWISPLLDTPPFRRLSGVSLSDVPGEILFQHPFPSRLEHSRGVYALARFARPRDRALHVAALAHDLGHGPLSHLTEPLMFERLGIDHEQRSVQLLEQVRSSLPPAAARQMAWLDWDEVAALMLGVTADGRGALLNGQMDYDNLDYVARFLLAGGLAQPNYDPRQIARALRPCASSEPADTPGVALLPEGLESAQAWLADRATLYDWLHEGHRDLASHAMLRKAVDLAAQADALPGSFFDMTDSEALRFLSRRGQSGQTLLVTQVLHDNLYHCIWEAEVPREGATISGLFARWRDRLSLEETLAAEAGLAPYEVVADVLSSSAYRELPPLLTTDGVMPLRGSPSETPPHVFHLFVTPTAGRDYQRRLRMAAERRLGAMGAAPLHAHTHE